jgi:excisionase family DNA binding protein
VVHLPVLWLAGQDGREGCGVNDRWVTRDEIADHLGVTKATVDAWVRERGMPSVKVGDGRPGTRRFWVPDVDQWVREQAPKEAA